MFVVIIMTDNIIDCAGTIHRFTCLVMSHCVRTPQKECNVASTNHLQCWVFGFRYALWFVLYIIQLRVDSAMLCYTLVTKKYQTTNRCDVWNVIYTHPPRLRVVSIYYQKNNFIASGNFSFITFRSFFNACARALCETSVPIATNICQYINYGLEDRRSKREKNNWTERLVFYLYWWGRCVVYYVCWRRNVDSNWWCWWWYAN